jgi:hypothetical protein
MNTTQTGIMLQSTNDSRIHEMLPNVGKQAKQMFNQTRVGGFGISSGQKPQFNNQQMRQTMFNSNFVTKPRTNNPHQPGKFNTFNQFDPSNTSDRDLQANRLGTTNSDNAPVFTMINQARKTPNTNPNQQQMMMTGQYFNQS